MHLRVRGPIVEWRGPAPFHFVVLSHEHSEVVREVAGAVTYGWGVVPVRCTVGHVEFTTSLFPRDGRYWVPLKAAARRPLGLELGDIVTVEVDIDV